MAMQLNLWLQAHKRETDSQGRIVMRFDSIEWASLTTKADELERQLAASRASAMEEAAAIVENGSAFSGYTQVASIHAKWIRDAINPPTPEAADAPPPHD